MVFHPKGDCSSYYTCIFTGVRRANNVSQDKSFQKHTKDWRRRASQQEGYLGMDDTTQNDSQTIIMITYWRTEEAMLKWKDYLDHFLATSLEQEEEDMQSQHDSGCYSDHQIHIAKVEPRYTTTTTTTKVSPDRVDVAPTLRKPKTTNKKKQPPQSQPYDDEAKEHLLTPVDIPPVYDPTALSAEPNVSTNDITHINIFECFAQSLEAAAMKANAAESVGFVLTRSATSPKQLPISTQNGVVAQRGSKRTFDTIVSMPTPTEDDDGDDHDGDDARMLSSPQRRSAITKRQSEKPIIKNLFAGNISKIKRDPDEHFSELEQRADNTTNSIFQYVIEDPEPVLASPTTTKRNTRSSRKKTTPTKALSKSSKKTLPTNPFETIEKDPKLHSKVAILMAMHSRRTVSRSEFYFAPPDDAMIQAGFMWEHFPACEQVLEECASEYFSACYQKLSAVDMRKLNEIIFDRVQAAIDQHGYPIHREFCDRQLRDRIRGYYKTLIANAKKRLATLEKHRDDDENKSYIAIFIRCAQNPHLTLRESVEMATINDGQGDPKRRRLGKVEQLRRMVED